MELVRIHAPDVSTAWLEAVATLFRLEGRSAFHTVVSIDDPTAEDLAVRARLDELLAGLGMDGVATVANTIFPNRIAATSADHAHLVRRYRAYYPVLRRLDPGNRSGTYFGRLVAYPANDGAIDQIGLVIERLQTELATGSPKSARYEAVIDLPASADAQSEEIADPDEMPADNLSLVGSVSAPVYVPGKDNSPLGFPCLSHCSFQLGCDGRLHALAQYRSQYMVQRAYGNYLGLGRLLQHVAGQAGLAVGQLTVVAGYAQVEAARRKVRALLAESAGPV